MRSMTAFGRACRTLEGRDVAVEIKSVNNRYLDCTVRLPRAYGGLEERVKAVLKEQGVLRGKVDVTVTVTVASSASEEWARGTAHPVMVVDIARAASYVAAAKQLSETLDVPWDLTASKLLALPMVLCPEESASAADDEARWALLQPVVQQAVRQFTGARLEEGLRLRADLDEKLAALRKSRADIAACSELHVKNYRRQFEERLRRILGECGGAPDETRVLTECALYADRVAIDEELVRLDAHFDALRGLWDAPDAVGRRIDFLLQEINREVNTIGSKCCDASIAQMVVTMKGVLEQVREQIQNIE